MQELVRYASSRIGLTTSEAEDLIQLILAEYRKMDNGCNALSRDEVDLCMENLNRILVENLSPRNVLFDRAFAPGKTLSGPEFVSFYVNNLLPGQVEQIRAGIKVQPLFLGTDMLGHLYDILEEGRASSICIDTSGQTYRLRQRAKRGVDCHALMLLRNTPLIQINGKEDYGLPIRDVFEDEEYLYVVSPDSSNAIEVLGRALRLKVIGQKDVDNIRHQTEALRSTLLKSNIVGSFELRLDETYACSVDLIPTFEADRDAWVKLAELLSGPLEAIISESDKLRAERVRTDALVVKGRESALFELPDEDPSSPCNQILRAEWCAKLWKIYKQTGKMDLSTAALIDALSVPGPWPVEWLKKRGGPVSFAELRNAMTGK